MAAAARVVASRRGAQPIEQQGSNVDTIESDVPIEEQAAAAERFTQGLVDAFDLGAQAKSVIDDDVVIVEVTGENLGLLVGPEGRDAARDRGAGAHGGAAPDRRSRRAHPRRRRRLPSQAPRRAGRLHPQPRGEGARDRSRRRRSSRCRRATARSSTTPQPRSTGSRRCPRARTPAGAWSCAPPDPPTRRRTVAMTDARSGDAARRARGGPRARPARARSCRAPVEHAVGSGRARSATSTGGCSISGAAGGCPGSCSSIAGPAPRACSSTRSAADASS